MHSIATEHLEWVRTHLRNDSGPQVFIEERETPFAILWDDSSTIIKYKDFGNKYCLQYLESRLETWDAWTSGKEKNDDIFNIFLYQNPIKLLIFYF